MALGRFGQQGGGLAVANGSASRVIELVGDSPELVALALLRQVAQMEQQELDPSRSSFDRSWLLNTYAECLAATRGERQPGSSPEAVAPVVAAAEAQRRERPRGRKAQ